MLVESRQFRRKARGVRSHERRFEARLCAHICLGLTDAPWINEHPKQACVLAKPHKVSLQRFE